MPLIDVVRRFTLHHESSPGQSREFLPGRHEVDDEVADHWFVRLMTGAARPGAPRGGALGVVDERVRAEDEARRAALRLRTEQEAAGRVDADRAAQSRALAEAEAAVAAAQAEIARLTQEAAQRARETEVLRVGGGTPGTETPTSPTTPEPTDEELRARARAEAEAAAATTAPERAPNRGRAASRD